MARQLRIVNASVDRPDERGVRPEDRVGPAVYVAVASDDLKTRPVHKIRLTEGEAVGLLADLAKALDIVYSEHRRAHRRVER